MIVFIYAFIALGVIEGAEMDKRAVENQLLSNFDYYLRFACDARLSAEKISARAPRSALAFSARSALQRAKY